MSQIDAPTHAVSGPSEFQRTRYFPRMVVGPEDLTRDQEYHIAKRRHWTLLLHGWGIMASGLRLEPYPDEDDVQLVQVSAGDAIARDGADITLARTVLLDPRREDWEGNACVAGADDASANAACTAVRRRADANLLVAVRSSERRSRHVRAPFGPRPDGSGRCEPTVLTDACDFRFIDEVERSATTLADEGWVVLGTLVLDGEGNPRRVDPEGNRHDFPLDPPGSAIDPPGEPGDVIAAVGAGDLALAEKHLRAWKDGIRRGLQALLDQEGRRKLVEIGPNGNLSEIPALHLAELPGDPEGTWHIREFFKRTRARDGSGRELSILCLAALPREDFEMLLREAYPRRDLIPDRVARHAHRAASLVFALAKQWPAPTFRELLR